MTPADLDRVSEIAAIGFPDHREDRACFENRLALSPSGCFVLQTADGLEGYLVALGILNKGQTLNSQEMPTSDTANLQPAYED